MERKNVKSFLEDAKGDNKLKNYLIDYYLDDYDEEYGVEGLKTSFEDLQQGGCQSGMIGSLIYYADTEKFYEEFKEDINALLAELMQDTGLSMEELFGDKFDKEDPLITDSSNKNLMAWFGFEETAYRLYREMFEDSELELVDEENEDSEDMEI